MYLTETVLRARAISGVVHLSEHIVLGASTLKAPNKTVYNRSPDNFERFPLRKKSIKVYIEPSHIHMHLFRTYKFAISAPERFR